MLGQVGYEHSGAGTYNYMPHVTLPSKTTALTPFDVDTLTIAVKDGETREKHIAAVITRGT